MDIMVIGGGGREHAIIKKIRENPAVNKIYALPGNGGIAADAQCVAIGAKDLDAIVDFAREHEIDFAVVAPDDPLVLGAVDRLHEIGIPCFGPDAAAARIEGSKSFAKELMHKYGIPTAAYQTFCDMASALAYLEKCSFPQVIKADGLALGKGVFIVEDLAAAKDAVQRIMGDKIFGSSGDKLIIEEYLTGPEVSVLAFTDGHCIKPMVSSMDHKRAQDNDKGLNTGGMGTVAPNPYYTPEIAQRCMKEIFLPTVNAMALEGHPFRGCLYFGLMLTDNGPKVIEYNCRFGDPEAQVVLPLLESDLLTVMMGVEQERLAETEVRFRDGAACCVIMASQGYPAAYDTGFPIRDNSPEDIIVYHAGSRLADGQVVTAGGRVLGVTAVADDLSAAIAKAYKGVAEISFDNAYYRHDIGARALAAGENK